MCFSASASFAAAGAVAVAGVSAVRSAEQPSQRLLAAIPLFFAAHQLAEGILWLALADAGHAGWREPAMFTYLFVAKVVWPVWVPMAIRAVEQDPARRRGLTALLAMGAVLAVFLAYSLHAYPVGAQIAGQHVVYRIDSPLFFRWVTDTCYVVVTVLPPLVSSIKLVRWLGLILLASFVISKILFYHYFLSVWCFFAALISVLVVLVVRRGRRGAGVATVSAATG